MKEEDILVILNFLIIMMPSLFLLVSLIVITIIDIRKRRHEHKENKKIGTKEWYENR